MTADGTRDKCKVTNGIRQKDDNHQPHDGGKHSIHIARTLDSEQIERRKEDDERERPGGIRNSREDVPGRGAAPDGTDDWIEEIVHEHGPSDDISRERMKFLGHIGEGRTCAGIYAGHATVANRGKKHRDHGNKNGGDYVTARLIADNAVDAHRRCWLDDDDAIDDEVPELERPLEMGRGAWGLQRVCFSGHSPSLPRWHSEDEIIRIALRLPGRVRSMHICTRQTWHPAQRIVMV